MEQQCTDHCDTATTSGGDQVVTDGTPDTRVFVSQEERVDVLSAVDQEQQASSDKGDRSHMHKVSQAPVASLTCVPACAVQQGPHQLNGLINTDTRAPMPATASLPSISAASTECGVDMRSSPAACTDLQRGVATAAPLHDGPTVAPRISSAGGRVGTNIVAEGDPKQAPSDLAQDYIQPVDGPTVASGAGDSQAWVIDVSFAKPRPRRKMSAKERATIEKQRVCNRAAGPDSEGNVAVTLGASPAVATASSTLQVVHLDTLAVDRDALIPKNLTTRRSDLEKRLVLRLPRLLCVNKQYPRSCGVSSLTSVYNYLYSWLGESAVGANRAPHSQEEIMSVLGFEPPFGEIMWGSFTGNVTLIRWFHALNRHWGLRGRAYILYKAHGSGKTTHLYADDKEALAAVKAALRDPHCALIYHCHNHYMVPIGYQDIPLAQMDFLKPDVAESNCETTLFIGEVSRGRHEAMYARKWSQIVKDIECKSPFFFNIRHPEEGVQRRPPKRRVSREGEDCRTAVPHPIIAADKATAEATTTAMSGAEGLQPLEEQGGKPSREDSTPVPILVAPPLSCPLPCPTGMPYGVCTNINGEPPGDAARSSSGDTVDVVAFTAAKPTLPPAVTLCSGHHHQSSSHSLSTGVFTVVVAEPKFASLSAGVSEGSFIATVRPTQELPRHEVVTTPSCPSSAADRDAYPGAPLAPPTQNEVPSAPLANRAVNSPESVGAVPVPFLPLESSSSSPRAVGAPGASTHSAAEVQLPQRSAPSPARPKKERGNLHCIICFRNDEAEPCMDRYEDNPGWLSRRTAASSSSSKSYFSESSSSSAA